MGARTSGRISPVSPAKRARKPCWRELMTSISCSDTTCTTCRRERDGMRGVGVSRRVVPNRAGLGASTGPPAVKAGRAASCPVPNLRAPKCCGPPAFKQATFHQPSMCHALTLHPPHPPHRTHSGPPLSASAALHQGTEQTWWRGLQGARQGGGTKLELGPCCTAQGEAQPLAQGFSQLLHFRPNEAPSSPAPPMYTLPFPAPAGWARRAGAPMAS